MCLTAAKYWGELTDLAHRYRPYLLGEKVGLGILHLEVDLACIGRVFDRHIESCPTCGQHYAVHQSHAVVAMLAAGKRYQEMFKHDDGGQGFWAEKEVLHIFLANCAKRHRIRLSPSSRFEDEICGVDFWAENMCSRAEIPVQFTSDPKLIEAKADQAFRQRTVLVCIDCHKIELVKKSDYSSHAARVVVDEFRNMVRLGLQGQRELLTRRECLQMEALHMAGLRV